MRAKLCFLFFLYCLSNRAQSGLFIINGADASLKVDSNSFISVDGDFYNMKCEVTAYVRFNGSLYLSGSFVNNDLLKFSGTAGSGNSKNARIIFRSTLFSPTTTIGAIIGGTVAPILWEVELDKGTGQQITLLNNISCLDTLTFKSGFLYLNGFKWNLLDPVGTPNVFNHPYLKNERNGCQFMPNSLVDTGLVIYKTIYTNSTYINPANIGIEIGGPLNIGSPLHIYRGVNPQINAVKSGILRYFDIYSSGHSLNNNLLKIRYTYVETYFLSPGYLNLSALTLYASPNTDNNWSQLPSVFQNSMTVVNSPTLNGEMSVNLSDLSLPNTTIAGEAFRITIADPNCINPPVSNLLLDTLHICTGNTLTLDAGNNSSVSNSSLKWEWYTSPAVYTRTLNVSANTAYQKYVVNLKDVRGCTAKDSVVIAPQAPFPQITYLNHLNACFGDSIQIKDTVKISSGTYSNSWFFSDSGTSTTLQQTFKKLFQSTGIHAYQLTATSNYGCSVTATSTNAIVYPLPTASFSNNFNCISGQMNFTNTSVSNYSTLIISGSNWNLGMGSVNTSTLFSPSQSYSTSGTYTVKLMATNSFGCKDSISSPVMIYPTNQALFIKNNSCFNDTAFFNNTSSCITGSCSYQWYFGDATQSTLASPKKVFSTPGLYTAKLIVSTPFSCPDSISTNIFVNPNPVAQFVSSNTIVCINEFAYLTNTSSITSGSISNYFWSFNNTFTSSASNAVTNYSVAGVYNISLTAVSDSGCVNTSISNITIKPQPTSQFIVNTACFNSVSQFVSTSTGNGLSYVWDFGNSVITNSLANSNQNYIYTSTGNYSTQLIVIDSWGCSDTSSVMATVLASPTAALGGTVSTCGNSYTLNAGNTGASYLWQPGNQTSQFISPTASGLYQVTITNTNTCIGTASVQLILNSIVKPHLGNDTSVCGNFILDAGYPGSSYQWNTNAINQTIIASSSGSYAVQVTDGNGCVGHDTLNLNIMTPAIIDLGNNITSCKPKYGQLITPTTNAQSFLWNTGVNTSTYTIFSSGIYWCEAILSNGCKKRDTLTVNYFATPIVNLGQDKSGCGTIQLDAQNFSCSYLWNTGESQQILTAQTSSNYWVTVTNTLTGCSQRDSIQITLFPSVNVSLGNDTSVCTNANFILNANNAGSDFNWTNGSSSQSITISSSGIYGVTVTNTYSCFASDYIQINLMPAPNVDLGPSTRYLCGITPVELGITNSGDILWESNNGLTVTSPSILVNSSGKYWATVNEFGCSSSDTVLIITTNNTIQASFLASTIDTINKPVKFVNLSLPVPTSQFWDFGDGTTSTELSPVHTYVLPKNYGITLEVSNGFCVDRIHKELNALFKTTSPNAHHSVSNLEILNFIVYPNPTENYLNFNLELNDFAGLTISIQDISSRLLKTKEIEHKLNFTGSIDVQDLANGVYIFSINAASLKGTQVKTTKFIKTN